MGQEILKMKEPIGLCNTDLKKEIFKDVMFFSLAEGGAMGEPGAVLFFSKSGELYYFNYVYGDVDINKVQRLFPVLEKCEFGMFGLNSVVPTGWQYVNLGMGNHLIVNDEVYDIFRKKIDVDGDPGYVYMNWKSVAKEILNNKEGGSKKMKTTDTGYINRNGQINLGRTSERGTDHGQWFYKMECQKCGYVYKANGTDIWLRKCPMCQGGKL